MARSSITSFSLRIKIRSYGSCNYCRVLSLYSSNIPGETSRSSYTPIPGDIHWTVIVQQVECKRARSLCSRGRGLGLLLFFIAPSFVYFFFFFFLPLSVVRLSCAQSSKAPVERSSFVRLSAYGVVQYTLNLYTPVNTDDPALPVNRSQFLVVLYFFCIVKFSPELHSMSVQLQFSIRKGQVTGDSLVPSP